MANILDYLLWRGDLSLESSPFNEVDSLVLSELSYLPFGEILSSPKKFGDAISEFIEEHRNDTEVQLKKEHMVFAEAVRDVPRFREMMLSDYVSVFSSEEEKQFAAIKIEIESGVYYVAFRGTDSTFVGWKEDFNMGFMDHVPSQMAAVEYLDRVAQAEGRYFVGGHSKGGNLAVFASAFAKASVREKIERVFNNDGPGFLDAVAKSEEYQRMLPKILTFIPQSSIIGMLLGHEEKVVVIRSDSVGIMQHDLFRWNVMGNEFVKVESTTLSSRVMDRTFRDWLSAMSNEERKEFVDKVYEIAVGSGARTTKEFTENVFRNSAAALRAIGALDKDDRKVVSEGFRLFLKALKDSGLDEIPSPALPEKPSAHGLKLPWKKV